MALIKKDYSSWKIETGNEEFDAEMQSQLEVQDKEIANALNSEGLVDRLLAAIIKERSEKFEVMKKKLPDPHGR